MSQKCSLEEIHRDVDLANRYRAFRGFKTLLLFRLKTGRDGLKKEK